MQRVELVLKLACSTRPPRATDERCQPLTSVGARRRSAREVAGYTARQYLLTYRSGQTLLISRGMGSNGGCLTGGPPTARNRKRAQKKLKKQRVAETYGRKPPTGARCLPSQSGSWPANGEASRRSQALPLALLPTTKSNTPTGSRPSALRHRTCAAVALPPRTMVRPLKATCAANVH